MTAKENAPRALGLAAALALLLPAAAPAMGVESPQSLEEQLELMMRWFPGRFDNHWQAREGEDAEHPHGRIHSIFAPVEMPEVGEHVFYVQQYSDGDPSKIYRQRIYSFRLAPEEEAIELVIAAPPDAAAVVDAHLDPSKLDGLSPDALRSYPGCEVYWQWRDGHFVGYTKENACRVESRRSGRTLIISDDLRLTADEIWIQDRAVDTDGNYVYGHKGGVPHKLKRARFFDCWAAVPIDEENGEWDSWREIRVHDQGGHFDLTPEGREGVYGFDLFQATYRGESTVDILELAVTERGKERSIAYTWADPGSKRIGINLRKLQIGCTRADPPLDQPRRGRE